MNIITDEQSENTRIDNFLSDIISEISRTKIQNLIKEGLVLVNDKPVKPSYILKIGDITTLDEKHIEHITLLSAPSPEDIPLEIVWENENMAVINKPSGMLTHPTQTEMRGTLVNALKYHYKDNLSDLNGELRRGIVHRLDRNTSGLIMIAKNNRTHEFLVNEMKEKHFSKKYLAIVKGIIKENTLTIDTPIGRHLTKPYKMMVNGKDAKESITLLKVIERFKDITYVELTLVTGRTHQIRVHLSSIGHPVYNDTLYGFGKPKIKTKEQVLQSYSLEFTKPFTEERINLKIDPDAEIQHILNVYRAFS